MKQKSSNTLYGYWNELRAGRIAPKRLEVEPARIAGILSETFMLERAHARNYQYRLAGTRLCELFGAELRATNFLAGWPEAEQSLLAARLDLVCEQGAVVSLLIEVKGAGRHRLEFEAILLPLLHTGNTIGRIIGAMSLTSPPPLFGSTPLAGEALSRRLIKDEVIWPSGRPLTRVADAGATKAATLPAPDKGDRPYLRVLDGGRMLVKPKVV
jgi:hypothetical protein